MNAYERIEMLEDLLALLGNERVSWSRLHNIIYLCQGVGIDFQHRFIVNYYGMYSPTLNYDARFSRNIKDTSIDVDKHGFKLKNGTKEYNELPKLDFIKEINSQDSDMLKVLSLIVYLGKNDYRNDYIIVKLREMVPYWEDSFEKAIELARKHYGIEVAG